MKNETLLEKAERLYSKGTKLKSTVGTTGVSSGIFHISTINSIFVERCDESSEWLCVYYRGRWAEIIKPVIKSQIIKQEIQIVQNEEGGIFKLNDKVKTNKGYVNNIKSFDIIDNIICAIFDDELLKKTHIDINLLELSIEPKDTFVLPELYHIRLNDNNWKDVLSWYKDKKNCNYTIEKLYSYMGINAIVGKSFKTGDCQYGWNLNGHSLKGGPNHPYDFGVEITFEQFKKYVLNQ